MRCCSPKVEKQKREAIQPQSENHQNRATARLHLQLLAIQLTVQTDFLLGQNLKPRPCFFDLVKLFGSQFDDLVEQVVNRLLALIELKIGQHAEDLRVRS